MKLLVIICSHDFSRCWSTNVTILNNYMKLLNIDYEYCGICNENNFHHYDIPFKYKIINPKLQFSKVCDFITDYKSELDYDWYIKFRPDVRLLENIDLNMLSDNAINARARVYHGPKKLTYGSSIGGEGYWSYIREYTYNETEHDVILDDMLYIFHHNVVKLGAFDKVEPSTCENEWFNATVFNTRHIPFNVISLYLVNTKYNGFSGNIN